MLAENLDEITKHMVPTALGRLQKLRDARVVDPLQAPVLDAMEAHVVSSASTYNVAQVCEPAWWISHHPAPSGTTTPMRGMALRGGFQGAHRQRRSCDDRFGTDPRGVACARRTRAASIVAQLLLTAAVAAGASCELTL